MKLILVFLFVIMSTQTLCAIESESSKSEDELKKMIGRMIVIGFPDKVIDENSTIVKHIQKYDLGGVILFDRFYDDRNRTKNISSPEQLQELTKQLKSFSNKPMLISIDQEGGKVARLKPDYGFKEIPSAKSIAKLPSKEAKEIYAQQAQMLRQNGINCDFAPVVDLAVNKNNKVIVALERSYGKSSKKVSKYAKICIDSLNNEGVISVLKHFPGHGSSLSDSHEGFVDISKTWKTKELEPYQKLINANDVQMIMTAHVFNSQLDKKYPATLSHNVNTKLLREMMGYDGVVISDDLQMKAITKHYNLKQTVTLAINSGVDMLLFGNQLASIYIDKLVDVIYEQVKNGSIDLQRIKESNKRIELLHLKPKIINKPIDFNENRIEMTKAYIKQHYGMDVNHIEIEPKIVLLHWTAVMDCDDSFKRLRWEKLYSDRSDIASAGSLNVSSHFLVDRNGTIFQLMPDNWMARHVIGLNYSSIGIENVGGEGNTKEDLTQAQVQANIDLIKYLKVKYPSIEYLVGHHEYREMEKTTLWLEKDAGYRTVKADPGDKFMNDVRKQVEYLELKRP